ncbi:hypothetical protein ERD95_16095 [Enterobacteriaceae bacterium ML5]|nr:hypothetical protein ERD95_16095 [Enterobacteriaceae bacterium ML5]
MEWQTIWAAISAVFTAITALIAFLAMLQWRKQDELKAKLAFKKAISDYSLLLTQMPQQLNSPGLRHDAVPQCKELSVKLAACASAWWMLEGLLDSDKTVSSSWNYIFDNNSKYFTGELERSELGTHCMGILHAKFAFK